MRERSYCPRVLHWVVVCSDIDAPQAVCGVQALCGYAGAVLHGTKARSMVTCKRCLARLTPAP